MDPRVNVITLAVADLAASESFYLHGLRWEPMLRVPGEVVFIRLSPTLVLSLWNATEFEREVGAIGPGSGLPPFTLAHNVPSEADVDGVLADAARAGGTVLTPAARRDWGGYTGYFQDPDGFVWEVAHNPGDLGVQLMEAEARARIGPVLDVIRSRRSVPQASLRDGPNLDHTEVVRAVESARWAPNHKRTEPWRFYLLDEARKVTLAQLWAEQLERGGSKPERVATKRREWGSAPGVLVVTCTSAESADEKTRWEDYAATACAVQNLCLHLWSKGVATKWSTGEVDEHEGFWPLLGHAARPAGTRVVALVFYGLADELPKGHRKLAVADVLTDFRSDARSDAEGS